MEKSIDLLSQDFATWFGTLYEVQQARFIYLVKYSFSCSEKARRQHIDRLKLGFIIISNSKYKTQSEYFGEEMYHSYKELGKTSLHIDWSSLYVITESAFESIGNFDKHMPTNKFHSYPLEHEHEYTLLFWSVLICSVDINFYLSLPIDFKINHEENRIDVPELWDIIDFLGMYLFSIQLYDIFLKSKDLESNKPIEELIGPSKRVLKPSTFEGLFIKKDNAQAVKQVFETKGYTENGQWHGLSTNKSELLCAFSVLQPLLLPGNRTSNVTTFYREFGLPENFISDRMKRNEQYNPTRDEFERIFSHLIKKERK